MNQPLRAFQPQALSVWRWRSMLRGSRAQVRSITWRLGRNRKWLALVLMP
jgi:hypothetical protein